MLKQTLILVGFIALAFGAAAVGVGFTDTGKDAWYQQLNQPAATPPGWVFPAVWNTLYTLMGIASYLLFRARRFAGAPLAWAAYFTQLALNASWSLVFFTGQSIPGALAVILALDLVLLATILLFWRIRPLAGALLLPYLTWLGIATYLNLRLLALNP